MEHPVVLKQKKPRSDYLKILDLIKGKYLYGKLGNWSGNGDKLVTAIDPIEEGFVVNAIETNGNDKYHITFKIKNYEEAVELVKKSNTNLEQEMI